jgi:hypothetical protein
MTALEPAILTFSNGAPLGCTRVTPLQKPPSNLKLPPLDTKESLWPNVPHMVKAPWALVPPPPSIVNQSIE